jgi:hypothetical protein
MSLNQSQRYEAFIKSKSQQGTQWPTAGFLLLASGYIYRHLSIWIDWPGIKPPIIQ